MTDIEIALTDLGEIATRDIASSEHPKRFRENMSVAARGGDVAKDARNSYEKATKKSAISNKNTLNYKYIDDLKKIENRLNIFRSNRRWKFYNFTFNFFSSNSKTRSSNFPSVWIKI